MLTTSDYPFVLRNESQLVKLEAQVVFGMPSKNCAFSGICKVVVLRNPNSSLKPCSCQHQAIGQLLFDPLHNELGFNFDFSFVNTSTWKSLCSDFLFSMDEDWSLPDEVCQLLNIQSFLVEKGVYPVYISEKGIRIWFEKL